MKKGKRFLAVLLSAAIAFSFAVSASAESTENTGKPVSVFAHVIDSLFGVAHDAIFKAVQSATALKSIPTAEEYLKQNDPYFYKGTQGTVSGSGWSAGFAQGSVIPEKWRCDADGNSDANGMCLKKLRPTGGYQTQVNKLYTDQNMNMVILSNGSDSNKNGVNDLVIFVSVDGVGLTAGSVRDIRMNIQKGLASCGVKPEDILSCNVSATHWHAGLDIQGMNIPTLFNNKINPFNNGYIRSLNRDMENSLCARAESCAKAAYNRLETGTLSFFETGKVGGASDKLKSGVQPKNYFSCFLFEGESGEKTVITNIGAHPTSYGAWDSNHMLCTDYPYFMSMALKEAGCNLVFTQSSEACISSPGIDYEEGDATDQDATAWIKAHSRSKEEWVKLYGQKYADKWYESLEAKINGNMKSGYLLAQFILKESAKAKPVEPTLNIKNARTLLSLDNGVMALGSISGLLGENVVKYDKAESGYGLYVETDYLEFGSDIAILTAPGELSPSLVYGSDPDYTGASYWNGKTSWTGETWEYDTLVNTTRKLTGDADKTVVVMGITNDALGYMFPDNCTTKSLLGTLLFYKENPSDMTNSMLMTVGRSCGSEIMEGFIKLLSR